MTHKKVSCTLDRCANAIITLFQPCVGIARLKRWQRADRLGLNPPIEVLAVLLKEEARGNKEIERAHMDELLNSTAVGGA